VPFRRITPTTQRRYGEVYRRVQKFDIGQVNLGRAARTDAGVHAAGNVVSLKMIMSVPGIPDMVSRINEELPPQIRLWGFVCVFIHEIALLTIFVFFLQVRVQNSFNARLFVFPHFYSVRHQCAILDPAIAASMCMFFPAIYSCLQNLEVAWNEIWRAVQRRSQPCMPILHSGMMQVKNSRQEKTICVVNGIGE
jgi:hypothetical protein